MGNQSIVLNGETFDLHKSMQKRQEKIPVWEDDIFLFLEEWFSDNETITVKTSGSTGTAKKITLPKSALVNSAIMTGDFFGFKPKQNALLCLPANFIAGKMMLVRAIEWHLDVDYIEPKIELDIPRNSYFFSAMTPPQVEANFNKISNIQNLIIGGAPLSALLESKLAQKEGNFFATYGMTETVSHVALRRIPEDYYLPLPNISFSTNQHTCLVIKAPLLNSNTLVTNDIVELRKDLSFRWIGRLDHVINSGGLKISPEEIEGQLANFIFSPFIITSIPDSKWGQKIVLCIESKSIDLDMLWNTIRSILPAKKQPKAIFLLDQFERTENGKINRMKTTSLLTD